jgi:hypothetical protein
MHGSIIYAQLTSAKPEVQADYETEEEVTRTPALNPEILNSHPNSYYHPGLLAFSCSHRIHGSPLAPCSDLIYPNPIICQIRVKITASVVYYFWFLVLSLIVRGFRVCRL